MTGELEARVRRLEDRLELRDLAARYSQAVDDRDFDTVVDCFSEDATVGRAESGQDGSGPESVRAFYARQMRDMHMTFHYPHTQQVTFDGPDSANGVVNAQAEMAVDATLVVSSLRYLDRYAREAGRWKIAERRMHFFWIMDARELATRASSAERIAWPGEPRAAELPETLATYQAFRARVG